MHSIKTTPKLKTIYSKTLTPLQDSIPYIILRHDEYSLAIQVSFEDQISIQMLLPVQTTLRKTCVLLNN